MAKERTSAIYQNIERAAVVIVDDVSSSHVFMGDVGSHIQQRRSWLVRSSVLRVFVPSKLAMESPKSSKSQTGRAAMPKRLIRSPRVVRWSPRHVRLGMVRMPVRAALPSSFRFRLLVIDC